MHITTLVPPASEPVALAACKAFLKVDYDGQDELITSLISAARAQVEIASQTALIDRTVRIAYDKWPEAAFCTGRLTLPVKPAKALNLIEIDGLDYTEQFVLSNYERSVLTFSGSDLPFADHSVIVEVIVGSGADENAIPPDLRLAVLFAVADAYQNGEQGGALSARVKALTAPWREVRI